MKKYFLKACKRQVVSSTLQTHHKTRNYLKCTKAMQQNPKVSNWCLSRSTAPPSLFCSTPAQGSLLRAMLTGLPSCLVTEATGQDPEDRGRRETREPPCSPPWSLGSHLLEASSLLPGSLENWGLLTTAIPWVPPHSMFASKPCKSLRWHHPGWNLFLLGPHLLWLTSPRLVIQKQCII